MGYSGKEDTMFDSFKLSGYLFSCAYWLRSWKRPPSFRLQGDLWCGEGKCVGHGFEALLKHTCTL